MNTFSVCGKQDVYGHRTASKLVLCLQNQRCLKEIRTDLRDSAYKEEVEIEPRVASTSLTLILQYLKICKWRGRPH